MFGTSLFLKKAVIDVNEGGVEAAGATAAGVGIRFGALPRVVKINRYAGCGKLLYCLKT